MVNNTADHKPPAAAQLDEMLDELLALPATERAVRLAALADQPLLQAALRRVLEVPESFLEPRRLDAIETSYSSLAAGSVVGAFRVQRLIGRGGMGEVYLAERSDPAFAQQVALKLLRPEAVARVEHFHNERRILAALEHPGIARLIDGGIAPDSRPYMVMEYVDGLAITDYCRARNATLTERLALFQQCCDAVAYAHRQLVVHRDLKPGNILVTGAPSAAELGRVKLLDFGIAQLLEPDDVSPTPTTRLVLTPEYASPEQLQGLRPTVATDVYALGVLLFELLAGRSPWGDGQSSLPSLIKRLDHVLPVAPSTLAAQEPAPPVLPRLLRGDFDAIVLKALRPEPLQRYESAMALWADLQRHLDVQPVLAREGDRRYRLRRFLRRRRAPIAAAALLLLTLLGGIAGVAWQAQQARAQRDAAIAEAERASTLRDYVLTMFRDAAEQSDGGAIPVRDMLKQSAEQIFTVYKDEPVLAQNIALALSEIYVHLGDSVIASELLQRLLKSPGIEANPETRAEAQANLAQVELDSGNIAAARQWLAQAQAVWLADPARYGVTLNVSRGTEADIESADGHPDRAISILQAASTERLQLLGAPDRELATGLVSLTFALLTAGRYEEALTTADQSVAAYESLGLGRSSAGLAAINNRAAAAFRLGQNERAAADFSEAVALRREMSGANTELAINMTNLAMVLIRQQKFAEAIPMLEQALQMAVEHGGKTGRAAFGPRRNLAEAYVGVGRLKEAEPLAEDSVVIGREQFGEDSLFAGVAYGTRAGLRLAQQRRAEAKADLDQAMAIFEKIGGGARFSKESLAALRQQLEAP